ncbi:MAG: hypothetical protein HW421_2534 [Ignavibacteria bacterium]|nr:hypothetical protein [Ignavibacteria bacterium]
MSKTFSIKTLFISIITGIILVVLFSWAAGTRFDTALYPVLALLTGFIVSGFMVGYISKGVTVIEPGLGAIIVACVSFFIIDAMGIKGFAAITQDSDWFIIMMNGVILTFVGAWLGEKFQDDRTQGDIKQVLDLSWIMAGTLFAVVLSIIIGIVVNFIFGNEPLYFIIPFFVALYFSGLLSGMKSAGVTTKEAGIAGFLTITIIFTIVRVTLVSEIEIEYIIGGLVLGYVTSLIGGWSGERIQRKKMIP